MGGVGEAAVGDGAVGAILDGSCAVPSLLPDIFPSSCLASGVRSSPAVFGSDAGVTEALFSELPASAEAAVGQHAAMVPG